MPAQQTFLVLGATGGTGKHFVTRALAGGHRVVALVRTPSKRPADATGLDVRLGSITDETLDLDSLVRGVDSVVAMLGDAALQRDAKIVAAFVERLIPAMRRQDVRRFFYQAGGMSRPYGGHLSPVLWVLRQTIGRSYDGQHEDNEAVMAYLETQARDIEWIVHRAGIGSDGPSKGVLERSKRKISVATFRDCADYAYRTVVDASAIHTSDFSAYAKP